MDTTPVKAIPYGINGGPADFPDQSHQMATRLETLLTDIPVADLHDGTPGQIIVVSGTGAPAYAAMSGDATIDNAGALAIGSKKVKRAMVDDKAISTAQIDDKVVGRTQIKDTLLQTQRSTLGAAIVPQSSTDVAMIWPVPFADTNYCVGYSLVWSAGSGIVAAHITAIDRFSATFTIKNIEAGGSGRNWSGGIHAIAHHD